MRLAIVGSRDGLDWASVKKGIGMLLVRATTVVSGGARGVDRLAAQMAGDCGVEVVEHLADWKGLGRSAGMQRNATIVDDADEVHAFWNGTSKGTAGTIAMAKRKGKPVFVYELPSTIGALKKEIP